MSNNGKLLVAGAALTGAAVLGAGYMLYRQRMLEKQDFNRHTGRKNSVSFGNGDGNSHKINSDGFITQYPSSRRTDFVENLHGEKVADPYRWFENDLFIFNFQFEIDLIVFF